MDYAQTQELLPVLTNILHSSALEIQQRSILLRVAARNCSAIVVPSYMSEVTSVQRYIPAVSCKSSLDADESPGTSVMP